MKKNTKISEFAIWILQYCIDNNITNGSFTKEQENEISVKISELSGLSFDSFAFDCGVLTSAAVLKRDALTRMINAIVN